MEMKQEKKMNMFKIYSEGWNFKSGLIKEIKWKYHAKWTKPVKNDHILYDSILMKCPW